MERNSNTRLVALLALVVTIFGVSVGFARFNSELTINSSADVKPDKSKFDVNFSRVNTVETAGLVTPTTSSSSVTAEDATIDNTNDPKITGLKAHFTEPGQYVTYKFYAHNAGEYIAYLNSVIFGPTETNGTVSKKCVPAEGTDSALVAAACEDISVTVTVGDTPFTASKNLTATHSLGLDQYELVEVVINYATNANSINRADGNFDVTFGPITLNYESVD